MKTFDEMEYHPLSEQLVQVLLDKTQSDIPLFYRLLVGFYFCQVASMMRCMISTPDRGDIPVNMYCLNLAPSGMGKGYSSTLMEEQVTHLFRHRFLEETFPALAAQNLPKIAHARAVRKSSDPDNELVLIEKEFERQGALLFSFDSGTGPAVKQLRHKLLMANAGSLNLQIDEIGSNLLGNIEVLETYFDMFDKGMSKQKLIKNTSENSRNEDIRGATPTNLLMFGTPSRLFNGGKTEEELYSMLESGYARRCFFGYVKPMPKDFTLTPKQILDMMMDRSSNQFLIDLSERLERMADISHAHKKLVMQEDTALLMIEYKLKCERLAAEMPEHAETRKAEIAHRYFKALKLAGAYAFIDGSPELTQEHLYNAIKLAELSGEAFDRLLTRDRPYVKLAKYLGSLNSEVTQADLVEDLPFYRGSQSQKNEMMHLASAWGYTNYILIKKAFRDGIEFIRGESLKPTDLTKMVVSYSDDFAVNYNNEVAPFDQLHLMTQANGIHWINHHVKHGHRNEENCMPGFNLLVIDVDGEVHLSTAKLLLKDYKAMYYTTKRHTATENRFRIILPTNFTLELDEKDYKEFYKNVLEWLPFKADEQCGTRSKKWLAHQGHYEYTEGQLFDVLPFIPKTSKNEERKVRLSSQQQMDNLERWVLNNSGDGNRNNMLLRYATILVDAGFDFNNIHSRVLDLNSKMPDKLDEVEIMSTVMVTVGKRLASKTP